ncbi:UNVERIFIED_CONTAM: hypothetical protein K2H54_066112 [Gekko kuhli]
MYVSYLLDKEGPSMYPGSVRHAGGLNLAAAAAAQNFVGAPQYPDYGAYHVPAGLGLDNAQSPASPWPAAYGAPLRDDWNGYGQGAAPGAAAAGAANAVHGPAAAGLAYSPAGEYHAHPHHPHHHPAQGPPAPPCGVPPAGGLMQPLNPPPGAEPLSPGGQRRNLCEWMRKPSAGGPGSVGSLSAACAQTRFQAELSRLDRNPQSRTTSRVLPANTVSPTFPSDFPREVEGLGLAEEIHGSFTCSDPIKPTVIPFEVKRGWDRLRFKPCG